MEAAASAGTSPVELACRAIWLMLFATVPTRRCNVKLHELIPPFGRILCAFAERRFDQEPRDRDAVLFRQGEQLGFFFGADLDLVAMSVTELVKTRQRITDLREQLTEAEREDKRAYVRATKDGWSPEELKKLGLESAAAGRRRKTANRSGAAAPAQDDIHGAQ
jgi:hypothetical protein